MKEEVFDESEGKIMNGVSSTFTATEVVKMNRELRKMRNRIDTRIRQLERAGEEFTVEDILAQNAFGTGKPQFYLLRYINAQIERKQELKKVGMAAAYKSTRSSLAKFIGRPDVRMSEVDLAFVRRYEDFLYSNGASGNTVSSPLVGTFYASPSPDAEPFVKTGDRVKKGQVLGIIEAMKLMNEIESEFDGTVKEILVENEQMVEFGQPMFVIE